MKLAIPLKTIETNIQISNPHGSNIKSNPPRNSTLTSRLPIALLMGHASSPAMAQLNTPITIPSATTISHTILGVAPNARITPISRRRSKTLRLIVVIKPNTDAADDRRHHNQKHIDHQHVLVESEPALRFGGTALRAHSFLLQVSIQIRLYNIGIGILQRKPQAVKHPGLLNRA